MLKTKPEIEVYEGSGNVFRDLELPHAEERSAQVQLSVAINRIIEERKLSKAKAAKLLGVGRKKISALQNYKINRFSVGRLMDLLATLGYEVVMEIRPIAAQSKAAKA